MENGITFLTGNKGKLKEATAIVGDLISGWSEPIDLPEIQSTDPQKVLEEKIKAAQKVLDGRLIVEDTSLFLSQWGNGALPGPYIKDFLKTLSPEGICTLAQAVGTEASAVTILGYFDGDTGETHYFQGELAGNIAPEPRGDNGFGWDPIFVPSGQSRTIAEMSDDEKNEISMRKQALEKLRSFLGGS